MTDYIPIEDRHLLWLDLETTGLDSLVNEIMEVSAIFSKGGEVIERFHCYPSTRIKFTKGLWSEYAYDLHTENGLLEDISDSLKNSGLSAIRFEEEHRGRLISFLQRCYSELPKPEEGEKQPGLILAGSNPNFDRTFMVDQYPSSSSLLHYRTFDSNVLYMMYSDPDKEKSDRLHRATKDVEEDFKFFKEILRR